jgi:hypothetical protein
VDGAGARYGVVAADANGPEVQPQAQTGVRNSTPPRKGAPISSCGTWSLCHGDSAGTVAMCLRADAPRMRARALVKRRQLTSAKLLAPAADSLCKRITPPGVLRIQAVGAAAVAL